MPQAITQPDINPLSPAGLLRPIVQKPRRILHFGPLIPVGLLRPMHVNAESKNQEKIKFKFFAISLFKRSPFETFINKLIP
jgi:hypothetical protein